VATEETIVEPMGPTKPEKVRKDTIFGINKLIWLVVGLVVSIGVTFLPLGLKHEASVALGLFVFVMFLWIFDIVPTGIGAVIFGVSLVIFIGGKTMPVTVAFAGFANATLWLIIGAFLIGEATVKTGLAKRIALYVMKIGVHGASGRSAYNHIVLSLWASSLILALLTPSGTVRVVMYIPIMMGILNAYKAKITSNMAANLFLHVYWAGILGSNLWYTGTNINGAVVGIAKAITGYSPSWTTWTVWNFVPCVFMFVGLYFINNWVFPPEKELVEQVVGESFVTEEVAKMGKTTKPEWRALAFFGMAILLWVTQPLHGIDPAWVAIGIGALLFLPTIGVLGVKALNNISWDTILLLGVALGIGGILKAVGLDVWIVDTFLTPIMAPFMHSGTIGFAFGAGLLTAIVHFLMASGSSETSAIAPLVAKFAQQSQLNVLLATLVVSRAAMNVLIFPYQSTPMVAMWGTGYMDIRKAIKGFGVASIYLLLWGALMAPYWNWIMRVVK